MWYEWPTSMSAHLPSNDSAYAKLVESIRRQPLAFVGSGLSVGGGYPTWGVLLNELRDEADTIDPRTPKLTGIVSPIDDMIWEAQEYRDRIGEARYRTFIYDRFKPNGKSMPQGVQYLAKMPFKAFITTNYDMLLSQAVQTGSPSSTVNSIEWTNQYAVREFFHELSGGPSVGRSVLHLHGRYDDPTTVILTESDYVSRYAVDDATTRRLFALFSTQCIVFVGFSLTDPDLMVLLRQAQATFKPGRPRHFAILPLKNPTHEHQVRRRIERKYGIIPVFYHLIPHMATASPPQDEHEGLTILLRRLVEDLSVGSSITAPSIGSRSASELADPNKGLFGGLAESNARRLSATVVDTTRRPGWFSVSLLVESTDPSRPLAGDVTFHLHPSFRHPERSVTVDPSGKASVKLLAFGSFTVGATADSGTTRLELDLAELPSAPEEFKSR